MAGKWLKQGSAWLMAGAIASSVLAFPVWAADNQGAASVDSSVVSDADLAFDLGILQGEGDGLTAQYLTQSTTRLPSCIFG